MKSAFMLTTVPQTCRNSVDGEMDALDNALVGVAVPMPPEQFELRVVKGIDIGKPGTDGAGERGIAFQQAFLVEDREPPIDRTLPLGAKPCKNGYTRGGILHELHVARGDGDIAL